MDEVKKKKADADDAKMLRLNGILFTEEEIDNMLQDAELDRQREKRSEEDAPSKDVLERIIKSVADNKIQQFKGDSDDEKEQAEEDEMVATTGDLTDACSKLKVRRCRLTSG